MRPHRFLIPALAVLCLAGAGRLHEVHVSNARVALEADAAYVRVRLYRADFEGAVREHAGRGDFRLAATAASDSAVTSYFAKHLVIRSGGATLTPTLLGSGEEKGIRRELDVWWVDFRYQASDSLAGELLITDDLLFERFDDQQNIMKVQLPSGGERTIVFVPGEAVYRLVIAPR